jgi:hypothetical protein
VKRVSVLLPGAVGVVCAAYTGIYLIRWEWNRAIIAGLFFVAAEVMVASMLVLDRIRRSEARILDAMTSMATEGRSDPVVPLDHSAVLDALRDTAPEAPDRFAWIRDRSGSMNVFLPVLLGAGVIASALAWAVEHVARATISPALERRLALQLDVLAVPAGGLLGSPVAPILVRRRAWPRRTAALTMVAAMGFLTAGTLDYVADRTQTRPDVRDPDAQTVLDLELRGAIAERDPDRVIGHLWSLCTGPDVFRSHSLPPPVVQHGSDGAVRVLVDTDVGHHGLERLRGCLNDAVIDKVQARVVNVSIG